MEPMGPMCVFVNVRMLWPLHVHTHTRAHALQ